MKFEYFVFLRHKSSAKWGFVEKKLEKNSSAVSKPPDAVSKPTDQDKIWHIHS